MESPEHPADSLRPPQFIIIEPTSEKFNCVIDRDSIETVLRQVQSGDLSHAQATETLLGGATISEHTLAPAEPLIHLVERLGPPPKDVANHWCQTLASWCASSGWQVIDPARIHRITKDHLNCLGVDASGQLVRLDPTISFGSQQEMIESFCEVLDVPISSIPDPSVSATDSTAGSAPGNEPAVPHPPVCQWVPPETSRTNPEKKIAKAETSHRLPGRKHIAMAASSVALLGLIGFMMVRRTTNPQTDAQTTSIASDFPSGVFSETAADQTTTAADQATPTSSRDKETDRGSLETSLARDDLESFEEMSDTDELPKFSIGPRLDAKTEEPNEIEQVTSETEPDHQETLAAQHYSLPPPDSPDEVLSFAGWTDQASGLQFQLPLKNSISAKPIEDSHPGHAWQIFDEHSSTTLASLRASKDSNSIEFQWASTIANPSLAKSLQQGRMQWNVSKRSKRTVYFRPLITAEPWRLDLSRQDLRPTWDLGWSMPANASSLEVEFDLPDDIEVSWITPVEARDVRKSQGVAILKPSDGESVDLRVQLDIRCTRKLSCRVQYTGRLDSSMPWQGLSRDLLDRFADEVSNYAVAVNRESERLQNVYDLAGRRGKRIIRIKQKRNDALTDQVSEVAKRAAELQSLIGKIEAEASLRFRLVVHWPSADDQVVFEMR